MNQNNISLEMVINGLECHKRAMYGEIDEHGIACNLCPYKDMESTCHSRTEGSLIAGALALLKSLSAFKAYFDDLYGKGFEIANYHLNGATEPFDNFYDSAMEEYENA